MLKCWGRFASESLSEFHLLNCIIFHESWLTVIGGRSANVTGHANAALEVQGYSQQMLRQPTGSLVTAVGPGGTDPFSSCSLDITPRMNILIDHCENWSSWISFSYIPISLWWITILRSLNSVTGLLETHSLERRWTSDERVCHQLK